MNYTESVYQMEKERVLAFNSIFSLEPYEQSSGTRSRSPYPAGLMA